jgi:hypothetical protein
MMVLFFYIIIFPVQIIVYRSVLRYFCSDLSVFDRSDFTGHIPFLTFLFPVTDRTKTYTSENDDRVFRTVFTLNRNSS